MLKFIPEYAKVKKLFLVSPYLVRKEEEYWKEFVGLIKCISETQNLPLEIVVVCNCEDSLNYTKENLEKEIILKENIKITYFETLVSDVWIRDYFIIGNAIDLDINEKYLIRAIYNPSYNKYFSPIDDAAGNYLTDNFGFGFKQFPFRLDGGNCIVSDDYIICSEKLFTENIDICTKKEIEEFFEKNVKQKLICVGVEGLDVVGHTDCIIRFLDNKTILLPMYPTQYRVDNRYIISVKNELRKQIKSDITIEYLPSYLSDEVNDDNIFSAEGIYLNYLRINDVIYFPSFDDDNYYQNEVLKKMNKINNKLRYKFIKLQNYAIQGGCLNCISNVELEI